MHVAPGSLRTDGLAARVADGGGDGVLWIHGYTLDSSVWGELWELLPGYRHIGVDLPGHGSSEPLRAGETLPELSRRVVRFARQHAVRHVIGLSFGGMLALQMAIEAPAAFVTLTLSSPSLGGGPQDPQARARNRELLRTYARRGAGPWMTELWMTWPPDIFRGAASHPRLWRTLQSAICRHSWGELSDGGLRRLTEYPLQSRELGRVQVPVLLLVGEHDIPSFKRAAELLRQGIARCERVYCAGAGHLCLLEAATTLAPLVARHLESAAVRRP